MKTLLTFALALFAVYGYTQPPLCKGTEVDIPNGGLRSMISLLLYANSDAYLKYGVKGWEYSPEESFTCHDMTVVKSLDANLLNIDSLEGLQFAVNLEKANLEFNHIEDISPLAALPKLSELNLNENAITDLSPLATMTSLESFSMFDNWSNLSDFGPIKHLTRLKYLALSSRVKDPKGLEGLAELSELEALHLRLAGGATFDADVLADLTKLEWVTLAAAQLENVDRLSDLPELERVTLLVCPRHANEELERAVAVLGQSGKEVTLNPLEKFCENYRGPA